MNQQDINFEKEVSDLCETVMDGIINKHGLLDKLQSDANKFNASQSLNILKHKLLKERWDNRLLYISNETSTQCSLKAERQRDALRKALNMAWNCIGFFVSVIKSGERWTDTCQSSYNMAQQSEEEAKKVE